MKKIIVLNTYSYVKTQIKNLMIPYKVDVLGATNSIELYRLLDTFKNQIGLLLIDINLSGDDAFMIMKKIRATHETLPMVILTTIGKRSQFIKGIQQGAVDYILLPLHEENFINRTMKLLKIKSTSSENSDLTSNQNNPEIDFQQYLSREFKRAVKGNYSLSIVMCTFFKIIKDFNDEIENEYILLNNNIYDEFKSLFWETDLFVKYGSQSFIGIFPFSDEINTVVILKKIEKAFDGIKIENKKYKYYNVENVFVTYPFDGSSQEDLLGKLSEKMKTAITDFKINRLG
jgi:PleD family two-component response regulator